MQGHMRYVISQKDEIVFLKGKLGRITADAENINNMHKRLSKAEEERIKEVIKSTSKVT